MNPKISVMDARPIRISRVRFCRNNCMYPTRFRSTDSRAAAIARWDVRTANKVRPDAA